MKLFFKAVAVLALPIILSSFQNGNEVSFRTELLNNKGSAVFDTSSIDSVFTPAKISDISDTELYANDFPESYDMRDYGQVQNVKSQGNYGTCWAQTAVDSAESSIIKKVPDIDLSEWHLAYYAYSGGEQIDLGDSSETEELFEHGGSALVASNLWLQWKGPVTEKEDIEYGNTDILTDKELQEKYYNSADYHLKNAYIFNFDDENYENQNMILKDFLLKGLAVDASYYNDSNYYDSVHNSYMSGQNNTATHSVTVIGYDDNFPAENFSSGAKPQNNGAWLAKNSWGNTWQDNGFFWISYEEPSLCEFSVFELEDSNNYSKNYHHDTFISNQAMSAGRGNTSYMANVFQSEGNEWIQAVSCKFIVPDTDYEINIYTNLKDNSDPTSGTKAYTTSGTNTITGCQTIELDQNIEISEGEYFSIVVSMTNSENPYTIPTESCISIIDSDTGDITDLSNHTKYNQIMQYTDYNESFFSSNGIIWDDVKGSLYTYSDEEKENLYNMLISAYGDDYVSKFEKNFGNDDVIIAQGNIPLKVFTNPVNHVDFSEDSGFIYSDETVELSCGNSQDIYYSVNGGEYTLYTEPLKITEKCRISATTDYKTYSEKEYVPAYSTLNRLGYTFNKNVGVKYISPDKNGNYTLYVDDYDDEIIFLPISQGTVEINGTPAENYKLTDKISLESGKNIISLTTETDRTEPKTINIIIYRGYYEFLLGDVNDDGVINSSDASEVLAEYALVSSGKTETFSQNQKKAGDFNNDGVMNSSDASEILSYYAQISSGK
ncbi:MAG TPA: hypothetical protein DCQ78_05570 [Ruminococcus sp.]|nr:hypothetical protein [Ruminococcus sp.]